MYVPDYCTAVLTVGIILHNHCVRWGIGATGRAEVFEFEAQFTPSLPFIELGLIDDIDGLDTIEMAGTLAFAPGDGSDYPAGDIEFEHQVAIVAPHGTGRDNAAIAGQQQWGIVVLAAWFEGCQIGQYAHIEGRGGEFGIDGLYADTAGDMMGGGVVVERLA